MTPFFLGKIIYITFTKVAETIWPILPYLYLNYFSWMASFICAKGIRRQICEEPHPEWGNSTYQPKFKIICQEQRLARTNYSNCFQTCADMSYLLQGRLSIHICASLFIPGLEGWNSIVKPLSQWPKLILPTGVTCYR